MKKFLTATVSAMCLSAITTTASFAECTNDVWNKVMERGKIVVGVKADYKPWGYRDSDGIWLEWKSTWQKMLLQQ